MKKLWVKTFLFSEKCRKPENNFYFFIFCTLNRYFNIQMCWLLLFLCTTL